MCVLLRLIASQIVPHRKNSLFRPGSARQGQVLTYPPKNARRMTGCDRGCNGNPTLAIAAVPPPRGAPAFSRLAADPARCRVGGVSAGKRAPARSAIRRCIEVHLRAPAPQVARRGHRAPAREAGWKAGAPSPCRFAVHAELVGLPQGQVLFFARVWSRTSVRFCLLHRAPFERCG